MPPAANARALDPGWDYRPEAITRSRCSLVSASGTTLPTNRTTGRRWQRKLTARKFREAKCLPGLPGRCSLV
ncbi:MAG: hypothetical protein LBQ54_08810 [Planctomycetaceae bacterium]|nr:hypothetical protein [Planctomycetaceae bacterium]